MKSNTTNADILGYPLVVSMPLVSLLNIVSITQLADLSVRPIDILFLCSFLLWGIKIIELGRIEKSSLAFLTFLFVFLFITILGKIFTYEEGFNWPKYIRFIQTMLWGLLGLTFITNQKKFERLLKNIIATGVILGAFSIYIFFTIKDLHRIGGYISYAGGEGLDRQASYNEVGALYALVMSIFLWRHYKETLAKLDYAKIAIVFCGLILVQSRSSFFALIFCIAFMLVFHISDIFSFKLNNKTFGLIVVILLAVIGTAFFSEYLTIDRLSESFDTNSNADSSIFVRFDLWEQGFSLLTKNIGTLFLGYGNGFFMSVLGVASTESFYLDNALSEGIIGMAVIICMVLMPSFLVWKAGRFSRNASLSTLVTIIALLVSITGNVLVDPMYGGITFLLLYAFVSVRGTNKLV